MKRSYRRHRNPRKGEAEGKPFFGKSKGAPKSSKKSDGAFFQAKLTVGKPGDKYEQEADSMADAVVNKTNQTPDLSRQEISGIQKETLATPLEYERLGTAEQRVEEDKLIQEQPLVQKDSHEEEENVQMQTENQEEEVQMQAENEEEEVQMQAENEEEEMPVQAMTDEEKEEPAIQTMSEEEEKEAPEVQSKCDECENEETKGRLQRKSHVSQPQASSQVSSQIKQSRGKGRPLPPKVRAEMEAGLGASFKDVNIHTNSQAAELNQKLQAQAFTHGKDIFFNSGKYNPDSTTGKRLLAHELTHVIQQNKSEKSIQKQQGNSFQFTVTPQLQWAVHALSIRPRREEATWACLAAAPEYDRPRILMNYLIQYQGNSAFRQIQNQQPPGTDTYEYLQAVGRFIWNSIRGSFMTMINSRMARNAQFRQRVEQARQEGCGRVPFDARGDMRGV